MGFFTERVRKLSQSFHFAAVVREKEELPSLKGKLFLKAYDGDELVYEYESSNVIVNTASVLIARLLKDSSEPSAGIAYLGVGSGDSGWDLFDPPAPTTSQTRLENEFYRSAIDFKTFVHPETGEPTTSQTNIVDYSTAFTESQAVGPIVEMSLFGGDATTELNTGTMVNWRTFPVVNKTASMTLTVIFRITS